MKYIPSQSHQVATSQDIIKNKKGYKKLVVWHKADELAHSVYLKTKAFPREELFGITAQLRRSALSIPTNIAEGAGRQNRKETKHFINIALGSLAETEYLLGFSVRLKYLSQDDFSKLEAMRTAVGALLWNLHKSISKNM